MSYKNTHNAWDNLSMAERNEVMKLALQEGISNLDDIRNAYNSFAGGGSKGNKTAYIHDVLPELLRKAGLNIRVTSGYRPVGAVGTAGSKSWHPRHGAVDIVPQGNTTFEDIERVVTTNPEIVKYMTSNGFGFLDETNRTAAGRALMKKTGATGNHFHFGKDTSARSRYQQLLNNTSAPKDILSPSEAAFVAQPYSTYTPPVQEPVQVYTPNYLPAPDLEAVEEMYQEDIARRNRQDALMSMLPTPSIGASVQNIISPAPSSFLEHPMLQVGNEFKDGGSIHIKPSHRGRLTELKKRTGKSEEELYNDGNPAHKKMVVFARNARKWKHGDGGPLVDMANKFALGGEENEGFFKRISNVVLSQPIFSYRGRPAMRQMGEDGQVSYKPMRVRENNSPTKKQSTFYEDVLRDAIVEHQEKSGGSNPNYDIPFILDKAILIDGSLTSTNALDSLAKYAGIHNRNPRLSEKPLKKKSQYKEPRKVNMDEMLGLSNQETRNGAWPHANGSKSSNPRALGNSNVFTAYGFLPADDFVNDYHYNDAGVSRSIPPLLDAFQYFAQGDYNRGDPNHTRDVNAAGARAWKNPKVKEWWETSGKYWYETGQGPK